MGYRSVVRIVLVLTIVLAGCSGGPVPGSEPVDATTDGPTTVGSTETNGTLEVHFINVDQSVATFIVGPTGETMLIDTGHFNDDGEYVLRYLRRHDVERIDYLITSHNDADHIGGNAAIIEYYETEANGIGAVYDPGIAASTQTYESYLDAVEQYDVTLYETREGDSIPLEGATVEVLGPPEPYLESEARNENSIVLKLEFGRTSFLFTGDAEDDQEEYLVEQYGSDLNVTVLKAGHHGSKTSTGDRLLDATNPRVVVISSAYDSQYGHPDPAVLERLAARDVTTYWTATHGDTVLVSDGSKVTIQTQQPAPTDPSQLREGAPIPPGSDDPVRSRLTITAGGTTTAAATATPTTDGGANAAPSLSVVEINADAQGDDRENLNDEYVVFENTGDAPIDLSGWTVEDAAGARYAFPEGFTLDPGERVTLHTGSGNDTETDLYWSRGSPVWNNDGDTVIVRSDNGTIVVKEEY